MKKVIMLLIAFLIVGGCSPERKATRKEAKLAKLARRCQLIFPSDTVKHETSETTYKHSVDSPTIKNVDCAALLQSMYPQMYEQMKATYGDSISHLLTTTIECPPSTHDTIETKTSTTYLVKDSAALFLAKHVLDSTVKAFDKKIADYDRRMQKKDAIISDLNKSIKDKDTKIAGYKKHERIFWLCVSGIALLLSLGTYLKIINPFSFITGLFRR